MCLCAYDADALNDSSAASWCLNDVSRTKSRSESPCPPTEYPTSPVGLFTDCNKCFFLSPGPGPGPGPGWLFETDLRAGIVSYRSSVNETKKSRLPVPVINGGLVRARSREPSLELSGTRDRRRTHARTHAHATPGPTNDGSRPFHSRASNVVNSRDGIPTLGGAIRSNQVMRRTKEPHANTQPYTRTHGMMALIPSSHLKWSKGTGRPVCIWPCICIGRPASSELTKAWCGACTWSCKWSRKKRGLQRPLAELPACRWSRKRLAACRLARGPFRELLYL